MAKKVLYIITKSDVGGAQKYISDLTNNLDKNLFEAKIFCGGKDLKWLSNKTWLWLFFLNDWLAIRELVQLYKKERPDIIHLNSSKAGVLGSIAAKIYKVRCQMLNVKYPPSKVAFTAHGWVFNPTNAISWPKRWFYIILHKFAALFQNIIICVSEYDYQLALRCHIAPRKKLITIHNGINTNIQFLEKEPAKRELTKKLKTEDIRLQTNAPWVGSIGRLVKEKNYETLIQAATLMPNAYFFIIGEGPEYQKLKVQNLKLKTKVFFIEPTGNDAQYLKAFDIFVMSSIKEGLPYILLEAMAAELPVVITEAGGMPEVIKNHENGLMVSQKNPELLAKAIQGLLSNQNIAKELGKSAGLAVRKKFSLDKMLSETFQIYSKIPR